MGHKLTMDPCVHVETDAHIVVERLRALPADLLRGPFQHADWIEAWLAVRAAARPTLALVTVTSPSTGAVLLALPLALEHRSGVPCWTAFDDGVSDYNAPLLAPDFAPSPETMRRIWNAVRERLPGGDLVLLEKLPDHVGDRPNPLLALGRAVRSRFARHPLALDDGIEAVRARYRAGRSLARKRRKLGRKGRLDFDVTAGADVIPVLDRLMSWRDRRHDVRPITTDLYRHLLRHTDLARVGVLRLDGEAIGGCFVIVEDRVLRLLVVAFDEARKNWSPGLLAIDDMIGWAAAQGLSEFDFTIGSEPYKFDFGVTTEPLWEVRAPLGLRGSVMVRLIGARRLLGDLARRAMPAVVRTAGRGRSTAEPSPLSLPAP